MTARGNLSSVYSITDNTRCKSRTVTTPSGPLEVPELSCEPGRQKQKRLGLFLSLRRRYKLKSVMAKYAFNSFIKQLSLKRSNMTSLLLFFLSSHQENVSFCARQGAQSGPLPAVLYRDGRHARGLQTLQVSADFFFLLLLLLFFPFAYTRFPPRRYVYHSSQWMVAGNTDHSCISPRLYVHPDSPCAGETWMRQVISFDRVKLTNNEMDDKGHVGNPHAASCCSSCFG